MEKCPEARLRLVGPGCDVSNKQLMSFLDDLGLVKHVVLHSDLHYEENLSMMRTSHVSILLSCFGESFPNVVAESIICGCYPIATDVGDSSLIIQSMGKILSVDTTPSHICTYLHHLYFIFRSY